jgi:hypothetical protein
MSEIDPEFMREIDIALYTMWDYANNQRASSPSMQIIHDKDMERAEAILDRLSEWWDSQ